MALPDQHELLLTFVAGSTFVLLLLIAFFIVLNRSQQRLTNAQLKLFKTREENQRLLLEAVLRGQEEERKRVARDLHDELGQLATVQKINLTLLKRRIEAGTEPKDIPEITAELDEMLHDADESINAIKRIIKDLRPTALQDVGLVGEIRNLIDRIYLRTGLIINLQTDNVKPELDQDRALEVFRIVQEALTNVLRHANATAVDVELQNDKDILVVSVKDNGKGINRKRLKNPSSFGLSGMAERAGMIGARLHIEKTGLRGTLVTLQVPLG